MTLSEGFIMAGAAIITVAVWDLLGAAAAELKARRDLLEEEIEQRRREGVVYRRQNGVR